MTRQKVSFSESNGNTLSCQINLLLRAKVSRAPELTDVSEKSDDVRLVSSPGVSLKADCYSWAWGDIALLRNYLYFVETFI